MKAFIVSSLPRFNNPFGTKAPKIFFIAKLYIWRSGLSAARRISSRITPRAPTFTQNVFQYGLVLASVPSARPKAFSYFASSSGVNPVYKEPERVK